MAKSRYSDPTYDEIECEACHEMKPEEGSDSVLVFVHRVEGMAVGGDYETICADCLREAEDRRWP